MGQEALTGQRKIRPSYVSTINARTPYLSSVYSQRNADKYRGEQQELAQNALDLQSDAADEAKKRNKLAENLGYANLGLNTVFGLARNWDSISDIGSSVSDFATDLFSPEDVGSSVASGSGLFGDDLGGGIIDNLLGDTFDFGFDDWDFF